MYTGSLQKHKHTNENNNQQTTHPMPIKTLWQRLTSETPKFWRKALKLGITLTAISTGLLVVPEGVEVPDIVQKAAGYLATAGFVLTVVAKATTTDTELSGK